MLIKSYGQFWNPDIVEWGKPGKGNKGKLAGTIKSRTKYVDIDFWNAVGIYVLHSEFKPFYVGKALDTSIGYRLKCHLTDRHAGRWDMFSWYSISKPRVFYKDVKKRDKKKTGLRAFTANDVVGTLEALSILIADPALNRKRETLKQAVEAIQKEQPNPKTIRNYLEEILEKLP